MLLHTGKALCLLIKVYLVLEDKAHPLCHPSDVYKRQLQINIKHAIAKRT